MPIRDPATPLWTRHALMIALAITALNLVACFAIVLLQRDVAQKRSAIAHARATLSHARE